MHSKIEIPINPGICSRFKIYRFVHNHKVTCFFVMKFNEIVVGHFFDFKRTRIKAVYVFEILNAHSIQISF